MIKQIPTIAILCEPICQRCFDAAQIADSIQTDPHHAEIAKKKKKKNNNNNHHHNNNNNNNHNHNDHAAGSALSLTFCWIRRFPSANFSLKPGVDSMGILEVSQPTPPPNIPSFPEIRV